MLGKAPRHIGDALAHAGALAYHEHRRRIARCNGAARPAGMPNPPTAMFAAPAGKPVVSVLPADCAGAGGTAAAMPPPTEVRTKSRRLKSRVGTPPSNAC